jgi:hypothetical protein
MSAGLNSGARQRREYPRQTRKTHPQQERRTVRAHVRHHVRGRARYHRVKDSGALTREAVATRYGLEPSQVKFFYCDNALAVKASIPRPCFQGDLRDADGHGGQQYAPLMDIEIP